MKDIEGYKFKLSNSINLLLNDKIHQLKNLNSRLNALNPLSLLNKGYSLVYKDDDIITSIDQVSTDDLITVNLKDGQIEERVIIMKELTIEEKFELLEKLVYRLENEKLSLEESIKLYEEAMVLSKTLSVELNEVTKKVLLIQEDGNKEEF